MSWTQRKEGTSGHGTCFLHKKESEQRATRQEEAVSFSGPTFGVLPKVLILGDLGWGSFLVRELEGDILHNGDPHLCSGWSPPPGEPFSPLHSSLHCKIPSQRG